MKMSYDYDDKKNKKQQPLTAFKVQTYQIVYQIIYIQTSQLCAQTKNNIFSLVWTMEVMPDVLMLTAV